MAHKQVLFRSAAREKVLRGATLLCDAVRVTLGPKSKSVLIQKPWGTPLICNDGETIAKEFDLKDPEENLGVQMLRQAAEKTGQAVGDGTSTSTILAHAIFADGLRNVVAGASAIDLKRGLDAATKCAIDALRAMSRPVRTRKEKAQVATISAHNDPVIGELVADAMEKVGGEGVITVEESKTTETSLEVVEHHLAAMVAHREAPLGRDGRLGRPQHLMGERRVAGILDLAQQHAHRHLVTVGIEVAGDDDERFRVGGEQPVDQQPHFRCLARTLHRGDQLALGPAADAAPACGGELLAGDRRSDRCP